MIYLFTKAGLTFNVHYFYHIKNNIFVQTVHIEIFFDEKDVYWNRMQYNSDDQYAEGYDIASVPEDELCILQNDCDKLEMCEHILMTKILDNI